VHDLLTLWPGHSQRGVKMQYIFICVCVNICMCIYMYIHVYTYIYIYLYLYLYLYIYMYICIYIDVYTYILYMQCGVNTQRIISLAHKLCNFNDRTARIEFGSLSLFIHSY